MLIRDLELDDQVKDIFLLKDGIKELYPPQATTVAAGLLKDENLVLAIPTASGKTLIAELAALNHFMRQKGKTLYLCPLRALASEKYEEFQRFEPLGLRVGMSSGDFDSDDRWLASADIIISTNEKMDALLRHNVEWINYVSLIVIDECHLIDEVDRGPTLEILIARLRSLLHNVQILALSATIRNADEIADWLNAKLILSDWRPVSLKEGVYYEGRVYFNDGTSIDVTDINADPKINLIYDVVSQNAQALVFNSSRRNAEGFAKRVRTVIKRSLTKETLKELKKLAKEVEETDQLSQKLALCVKSGVAFHHAGLNARQRGIIEKAFKKNQLKVISATPTLCLAQGTHIWYETSETEVSIFDKSQPLHVLSNNKLIPMTAQDILDNGSNSRLIEITSISGYSIRVTPNHKMYIKRRNQKMTIPAEMVRKTDKIATVRRLDIIKTFSYTLSDFVQENNLNNFDCNFDSKIAYFIGLMLGDGYSGGEIINKRLTYKGSPLLVNSDEDILSHAEVIADKLNISSKRGENVYGCPQIRLGKNKWFREFLVRCGVDVKEKKHISEKILNMDLEIVSNLLKGLFDSDGYTVRKRGVGFSSISELLIKQVQKLLLRFGIVCRLRKRKGKPMQLHTKKYQTKSTYELFISQNQCILDFHRFIGFNIKRKQVALEKLVNKIQSNLLYISCEECGYKIYKDLFSGRTKSQKEWGQTKFEVINILGKKGELGSRIIASIIGTEPKKGEKRLDHHYELIRKRKIGHISQTEWFWSLNEIGQWIYDNYISLKEPFELVFKLKNCPLCGSQFNKVTRKNWRVSDLDEDIHWDLIRDVKKIVDNSHVYDVVLPNHPQNDHMFVANGFIVHNSAGCNLPARRVIISSVYRFERGSMKGIKVLEYKQMSGRAGRPKYDPYGESIILAQNHSEMDELRERYIEAKPERVISKLASEPALRKSLLGLITSHIVKNEDDLLEFFEKTLYIKQSEIEFIIDRIKRVLHFLNDEEFISYDGYACSPTPYGIRVAQLYLDPLSAAILRNGIDVAKKKDKDLFTPIGIMQLLATTPDMINLYLRKKDWELLDAVLAQHEEEFLVDIPESYSIAYESFLQSLKTALLMEQWIEETPMENIIRQFNVGSGDIARYAETARWLSYAGVQIAKLLFSKYPESEWLIKAFIDLELRVLHGVREEAIALCYLKGVGRVRARALIKADIKSITDLKEANPEKLLKIPGFGPEIVRSLKEQVSSEKKISQNNITFDEELGTKEKTTQSQKDLLEFLS